MKKLSLNYLSISALALILLAGCDTPEAENGNENGARERVVTVSTMIVDAISFDDKIRINGNVAAYEDAMISVETAGQVLFAAERGTRVNRGDIILRLDDRLLKSGFEAARTGYELSEDVYKRQAALYADSVISTVQYLQSKAQRDQAKAQLESIQKQLNDANLRAPFSGRIEERMTSTGSFVGPGTPVFRIVNTSRVKVTGGVPERYAGRIRQNTPVQVDFRNYGIERRNGTIRFAGNLINPDSRTFPVEILLDNPNELIKPSMVVDMQVLRGQIDQGLIIPRTALNRDEGGVSLFVVDRSTGQPRATLRRVEIDFSSGDFIGLRSGIQPGEEVIVTGLTSLSDGDLINITATTSNSEALPVSER